MERGGEIPGDNNFSAMVQNHLGHKFMDTDHGTVYFLFEQVSLDPGKAKGNVALGTLG